jgi:hypothetical protein
MFTFLVVMVILSMAVGSLAKLASKVPADTAASAGLGLWKWFSKK